MKQRQTRTKILKGIINRNKNGHATVKIDNEQEIFIHKDNLHSAQHLDEVEITTTKEKKRGVAHLTGHVTSILQRNQKILIGRVYRQKGIWWLNNNSPNYPEDLPLSTGKFKLNKNDVVTAVIASSNLKPNVLPQAKLIEVLGDADNAQMEIEIALRKFNLPYKFSSACMQQVKKLPNKVLNKELVNRVDLTDLPLVTIDGEDAKDFDDAVYAQEIKVGRRKAFRLVVAIADVSHYVTPKSAIDLDAIERATSVYFPRRVIPMLPEQLSNELCSLNPNVNRLAMVADIQISATNGTVLNYKFYPAVIFSHARLTYTQVNALLENPNAKHSQPLQQLKPHLLTLYKLFKSLLKNRQQRGALDFNIVETQMQFDQQDKIVAIEPRVRNDAHRLIEEAMLVANVCAADLILQSKQRGAFRVHDNPNADKIISLKNYLQSLAINVDISEQPTPKELQQLANAVKDRPDAQQIHQVMLRCLAQAVYAPDNIGHYGLAYTHYTHFTSPIRRYPDLLVHRLIKAILNKKTYHLTVPDNIDKEQAQEYLEKLLSRKKLTQQELSKKDKKKSKKTSYDAWQIALAHCSHNERRADEASLDVQAWLKCQYMQQFIGQEFDATVSSVTSFGLFVTLKQYYVEGLVHITELGNDYFVFDQDKQQLVGQQQASKYSLASTVRVKLVRVNSDLRQIDFVLVANKSSNPNKRKIITNKAVNTVKAKNTKSTTTANKNKRVKKK